MFICVPLEYLYPLQGVLYSIVMWGVGIRWWRGNSKWFRIRWSSMNRAHILSFHMEIYYEKYHQHSWCPFLTKPLLKTEACHQVCHQVSDSGVWTMIEQGDWWAQKQLPLQSEAAIPDFPEERCGDPISLFWLKKLEAALWGIPPGERFHYRDWDRAFVVVVVDNSQMPGLQSLLFPILHLCLFEVFHFQKIKQKTHSCKMPLPLPKLQLFQSWFSLVIVKDGTILI